MVWTDLTGSKILEILVLLVDSVGADPDQQRASLQFCSLVPDRRLSESRVAGVIGASQP